MPDYCRACGDEYTQALGPGWDTQPWAVEYFQAHRNLMYQEKTEASWTRLDGAEGLDTLVAVPIEGRPGATGKSQDVLDGLIADLVSQGLGGTRIHRQLTSQGWKLSERTVYYKMLSARVASAVATGVIARNEPAVKVTIVDSPTDPIGRR